MTAPKTPDHDLFMGRALQLAERGWGQTHPNPMVGAVIVERGEVVAEGWHRAAGEPHAEIEALRHLGRQPAAEATLYITLEPCSTRGKTGACTQTIIESGIKRVVVGAVDPNPGHCGAGLSILQEAGIEVIKGVLGRRCEDLNLIFNHWISRHTPLIAIKLALTLDGKFAAASGHSKWVTSPKARADVMRWRRYFPAIAVGAATVLQDDPRLTSRVDGDVWTPRRFIFDRCLDTLVAAPLPQVYSDDPESRTTVLCSEAVKPERQRKLEADGFDLWLLPEKNGHLDFTAFRDRCRAAQICGVLVEAGPGFSTTLIEERLIDYALIYQAPKFMGDSTARGIGSPRGTESMEDAVVLRDVEHAILDDDVLTRGFFD